MKKKNIIKILGILSGLLIVLGVFFPFIKTGEISTSLWNIFLNNKQIYLSIIIIVFGLIPIVLYFIDKNIEYSYASSGSLLFFIAVEIYGTVSKLGFQTLNLGFYLILFGVLLNIIVTTISVKKEKLEDHSNKNIEDK